MGFIIHIQRPSGSQTSTVCEEATASGTQEFNAKVAEELQPLIQELDQILERAPDAHGMASSATFGQTTFNATNLVCGISLLTMPYAVAQAGWIALGLPLAFGSACFCTAMLLSELQEGSSVIRDYPAIGQRALGPFGRLLVSALLYVELFSSGVEYLIMGGESLHSLLPHVSLFGLDGEGAQVSTLVAAALLLPTVFIRSYSKLAMMSTCGVAAIALVLSLLVGQGVSEHAFEAMQGMNAPLVQWSGLPISISLVAFGFSGHSVLPELNSTMANKKLYPLALLVATGVAVALNGLCGFAGFGLLGQGAHGQVVVDMEHYYPTSLFTQLSVLASMLIPLAKYSLMMQPLAQSIEEPLTQACDSQSSTEISSLVRVGLVGGTVAVALGFPFFTQLMAVVGSAVSTSISITLPCAFYLIVKGSSISKPKQVATQAGVAAGLLLSLLGLCSSCQA